MHDQAAGERRFNESVSMQSMTLTIQALRVNTLTRRWFLDNLGGKL